MISIEEIANIVSIIGTWSGICSRVRQVIKTDKIQSVGDSSSHTMAINITANSFFYYIL